MIIFEFFVLCCSLFVAHTAIKNTLSKPRGDNPSVFLSLVFVLSAAALWPAIYWVQETPSTWFFSVLIISSAGLLCIAIDMHRDSPVVRHNPER